MPRKNKKKYNKNSYNDFLLQEQNDYAFIHNLNDDQREGRNREKMIERQHIGRILKSKLKEVTLTSKQREYLNAIRNNDIVICEGPSGTSKAQPLSSQILTPSGWVSMGDITVGQEVISLNGDIAKVVSLHPQEKQTIYQIKMDDGSITRCTGEHVWTLYETEEKINTQELIQRLHYGQKIKLPRIAGLKNSGLKPKIEPWLWGWLSQNSDLVNWRHNEWLVEDDIKIKINQKLKIYNCYIDETHQLKARTKNSFQNFQDLIKDLNTERGFLLTPACLWWSEVDRLKLVAGMLCYTTSPNKDLGYITGLITDNETIVHLWRQLIRSIGGQAKVKKNNWGYSLYVKLPSHFNPYFETNLNSKLEQYNIHQDYDSVFTVDIVSEEVAQCIKIDHPSHLYVTDDYIVTHNTYTSTFSALTLLAEGVVSSIKMTKPIQESGENLGFLPGGISDKIDPYMDSYYSTLEKLIGKSFTKHLIDCNYIEAKPLAYMRGTNMDQCIMLMDEMQNADLRQIMLWVTRMGEGTKAVGFGDISQYDINSKRLGVKQFIRMIRDLKGIEIFSFDPQDIVRNPILTPIVQRYEKLKYGYDKAEGIDMDRIDDVIQQLEDESNFNSEKDYLHGEYVEYDGYGGIDLNEYYENEDIIEDNYT